MGICFALLNRTALVTDLLLSMCMYAHNVALG